MKQYRSQKEKQVKSKKKVLVSMGQNVPQIGQSYILMTRIGQKKPLLVRNGPKFSNWMELFQTCLNWFLMAQIGQKWPRTRFQ